MRYTIVSLLLLTTYTTRTQKLEDKISIEIGTTDRPVPVDLTLQFPPKTTSQIIRIFTAVTGLVMFCYGALWSSKDETERCIQTGLGLMLTAFTIIYDPTDQLHTLSTKETNALI